MSKGGAFGPRVLAVLHGKESGKLLGWIRNRGIDDDDAEDLAQEAFTRLWAKRGGGLEDPRAYLYTVARNLTKNFLRDTAVESECREELLPTPSREPTPLQVLERRALEEVIDATVDDLPTRCRDVCRLRMEGLRNAEIAEVMGTTPETVRVQLHKAKKAIREAIRPLLGE